MKRKKSCSCQQFRGQESISKANAQMSLVIVVYFSLLIELVVAIDLIGMHSHACASPLLMEALGAQHVVIWMDGWVGG